MTSANLTLYGLDVSYFTQKMLVYLDYAGVPYTYIKRTMDIQGEIAKKVGSNMIPVVETTDGAWLYDTTPMMQRFDAERGIGALFPPLGTPVRVLVCILEDYLDEWFPRFAIWSRWHLADNREQASENLMREALGLPLSGTLTDEQAAMLERGFSMIRGWAETRIQALGMHQQDADAHIGEMMSVLTAFDAHVGEYGFVLGPRLSAPDIVLAGALAGHFLRDEGLSARVRGSIPNLIAHSERVRSMTPAAVETVGWPDLSDLQDTLQTLLPLTATYFAPFLRANRDALAAGQRQFVMDTVAGPQAMDVRKYSEKCRQQIVADAATLSTNEQKNLFTFLETAGYGGIYEA